MRWCAVYLLICLATSTANKFNVPVQAADTGAGFSADAAPVPAGRQLQACGAAGQACCPRCPSSTSAADCNQQECASGLTCYMFASRQSPIPDGTRRFPMVCLETPECGGLNQVCCYNSDPTSESGRCRPGMTCIVESVGYGDQSMYALLTANPSLVRSTSVMGVCRKLTTATCGKRWYPCGAAARRIGCAEKDLLCGPQDYCASPADTMLAAARCLPLPSRCGLKNNGCCPPNKDGVVRERWLLDSTTPVPYCTDGQSFCLWKHTDYHQQGLAQLNSGAGSRVLTWDGYFQRGYGVSRCAPLPPACGNPGEPCCPSMIDQRISGMVHNKRFKFQPCNYAAAGKLGIYCKGAWQSSLLAAGVNLGTCTLNTADCGTVGKQCCREDVPEVGPVAQCAPRQQPGTHYCTTDNVCSKCPTVLTTADQRQECRQQSG